MITRSNVRVGEINVAPKMVIMVYPTSRDIDILTKPIYSSDVDQPENKAKLSKILEKSKALVITDDDDNEREEEHSDNFMTLYCQVVIEFNDNSQASIASFKDLKIITGVE